MRSSSDVDPRPLREIYLRGFQRVVEDAQPWTVMCSYNRINGVYASEDPWLLTKVLRDEWGFEGLVVSDWGAVNDRVAVASPPAWTSRCRRRRASPTRRSSPRCRTARSTSRCGCRRRPRARPRAQGSGRRRRGRRAARRRRPPRARPRGRRPLDRAAEERGRRCLPLAARRVGRASSARSPTSRATRAPARR